MATGQFMGDLELLHWGTAGGSLHELGHALNSPHNAHRASENPNRSMMGGGGANRYNSGQNLNSVVLTSSSAAIFDVSEAFNRNDNGIAYYEEEPTITLKGYTIKKVDAEALTRAQFTFTSDVVPKHLYVAMDAHPSNVNNDYDRVTFMATVTPTTNPNEYYAEVDMPYAEFFNGFQDSSKTNGNIELSVHVLTENGFRTLALSYDFTIAPATSPVPDDNINKQLFQLSDRSAWTIGANSFTPNGGGHSPTTMIDADYNSFWYSDWPYRFTESGPHIINVDMGGDKTFKGVYVYSKNSNNVQFRPKHVVIEVSQDGESYSEALTYFSDSIDPDELMMEFGEQLTARYFRLTIDEVYKSFSNHADNLIINELDVIVD